MALKLHCSKESVCMSIILATTWWSLLVRGLVALALGILTVVLRQMSLSDLTLVFFGYAMIDGVVNLAGAITAAQSGQRWWGPLILEAVLGIATAVIVAAWPGMTITGLIYVIAGWGLATGALEIAFANKLGRRERGKWLLGLSGAASVALGIVMVAVPLAWTSSIALWLGAYAFIFGALLLAIALRVRPRLETRRETRLRPAA
jgi:uncharacterized membrane protein HdeD (DUF308 family)